MEQRSLIAYLADGFDPTPFSDPAEIVTALVKHCEDKLAANRPNGFGISNTTLNFRDPDDPLKQETVTFLKPRDFQQRPSPSYAVDGQASPPFRHPFEPIYPDGK